MDQDSFTRTGRDAGSASGYGSRPELDREATADPGYGRREPSGHSSVGHDRSSDDGVGRIRGFLEDQLRERPLPTLLAGVLAGWIAGKLLR
jgi:hypothetical protein